MRGVLTVSMLARESIRLLHRTANRNIQFLEAPDKLNEARVFSIDRELAAYTLLRSLDDVSSEHLELMVRALNAGMPAAWCNTYPLELLLGGADCTVQHYDGVCLRARAIPTFDQGIMLRLEVRA